MDDIDKFIEKLHLAFNSKIKEKKIKFFSQTNENNEKTWMIVPLDNKIGGKAPIIICFDDEIADYEIVFTELLSEKILDNKEFYDYQNPIVLKINKSFLVNLDNEKINNLANKIAKKY